MSYEPQDTRALSVPNVGIDGRPSFALVHSLLELQQRIEKELCTSTRGARPRNALAFEYHGPACVDTVVFVYEDRNRGDELDDGHIEVFVDAVVHGRRFGITFLANDANDRTANDRTAKDRAAMAEELAVSVVRATHDAMVARHREYREYRELTA